MYYLQSRYYDPVTHRFINADSQLNQKDGILGFNTYAYCNNNPIIYSDPTGHLPFFVITAAVGAVAGAVYGGIKAAKSGGNVWAGIGIGAAVGGLVGAGLGAMAGAAFAGSAVATTTQVAIGVGQFATTVAIGGVGAGTTYIANNLQHAGNEISNAIATSTGKGFDTFRQLKNEIGTPGAGNEWHHIVEQCQIGKSGFSPQMIHNTNNIISISKTTHSAISGYYSSIQPFTNGMIVRNWLAGQSFSAQYEFGLNVIRMFR